MQARAWSRPPASLSRSLQSTSTAQNQAGMTSDGSPITRATRPCSRPPWPRPNRQMGVGGCGRHGSARWRPQHCVIGSLRRGRWRHVGGVLLDVHEAAGQVRKRGPRPHLLPQVPCCYPKRCGRIPSRALSVRLAPLRIAPRRRVPIHLRRRRPDPEACRRLLRWPSSPRHSPKRSP